jgi:hypothetical protein
MWCLSLHVCCSPFASRDNIYKGPISIVAAVNDPADSEGTSYHIAFHVADVNPNSSPLPAAANNAMQSGNGTTGEASAQPIPKAVPMPPYPLDLKLSVKREGDKAVGTATITNPTKGTVQVRGSRLFTLMHMSARQHSTITLCSTEGQLTARAIMHTLPHSRPLDDCRCNAGGVHAGSAHLKHTLPIISTVGLLDSPLRHI